MPEVKDSPLKGWTKQQLMALRGRNEPRLFTKPLRELTRETTLGFDVIDFAHEVLGIELVQWQQWLLIHALELNAPWTSATVHQRGPRDRIFRFRKIVVLVARQNGKTTLGIVLALYMMYVLKLSELLGLAQDLGVAEKVLEETQEFIDADPDLAEQALPMRQSNGKMAVRLRKEFGGSHYRAKATSGKATRGYSADWLFFDELRTQQAWDAWGAVTKTTNARPSSIVWCMSNAGDLQSQVLLYLRLKAHEKFGDPDGWVKRHTERQQIDDMLPAISTSDEVELDDLPAILEPTPQDEDAKVVATAEELVEDMDLVGFFEWSAPPELHYQDPEGWSYANPSLGYTGLNGVTLAADAISDPEDIFRTENLCQWVESLEETFFPKGAWEAGWWEPTGEFPEPPQFVGTPVACIDIPPGRGRASIALAGYNEHGQVQLELAALRSGIDWAFDWLKRQQEAGEIGKVTGQTRGAPVAAFLEEAKHQGIDIVDWQGPDLSSGTARFFDSVVAGEIVHFQQPAVDMAARRAAVKYTGDGAMYIDRFKSPIDAAPLVAFAGSFWLLTRHDTGPVSDYEDDDLKSGMRRAEEDEDDYEVLVL